MVVEHVTRLTAFSEVGVCLAIATQGEPVVPGIAPHSSHSRFTDLLDQGIDLARLLGQPSFQILNPGVLLRPDPGAATDCDTSSKHPRYPGPKWRSLCRYQMGLIAISSH